MSARKVENGFLRRTGDMLARGTAGFSLLTSIYTSPVSAEIIRPNVSTPIIRTATPPVNSSLTDCELSTFLPDITPDDSITNHGGLRATFYDLNPDEGKLNAIISVDPGAINRDQVLSTWRRGQFDFAVILETSEETKGDPQIGLDYTFASPELGLEERTAKTALRGTTVEDCTRIYLQIDRKNLVFQINSTEPFTDIASENLRK